MQRRKIWTARQNRTDWHFPGFLVVVFVCMSDDFLLSAHHLSHNHHHFFSLNIPLRGFPFRLLSIPRFFQRWRISFFERHCKEKRGIPPPLPSSSSSHVERWGKDKKSFPTKTFTRDITDWQLVIIHARKEEIARQVSWWWWPERWVFVILCVSWHPTSTTPHSLHFWDDRTH